MKQELLNKKISEVEELKQKFQNAKTIVVFEYHGLSDEQNKDIRRKLRAQKCEMKVYKNNIASRAAVLAGFAGLDEVFFGPKAVAISYEDVVAPAKVLFDYAKTNDKVVLTAGVIEGKVSDKEQIIALATIPSREVLLTQLAAGLLQPLQQLAVGLNMIEK